MKQKIILISFICTMNIFGQGKEKPKSKSDGSSKAQKSSATQQGSGSTSLDEGFHYILKPNLRYIFHYGTDDYRYLNPGFKNIYRRISITQGDSGKLYIVFKRSFKEEAFDKGILKYTFFETSDKTGNSLKYVVQENILKNAKNKEDSIIKIINNKPYFKGQDRYLQLAFKHLDNINYFKDRIVIAAKTQDNKDKQNILKPLSEDDLVDSIYLQINSRKKISDPTSYIKFHYRTLNYGAITIPFVFRPAQTISGRTPSNIPSDATANLSVALSLGYKIGSTRFYFDGTKSHNSISVMPLVFLGPGVTTINAQNAVDPKKITNPVNIGLITMGGGLSFEVRSFNFGIYVGVDAPLDYSKDWVYSYNKLWVGAGIGFNLGMFTNGNSQ